MFEKMTLEQMDEAAKQAEEELKTIDQKVVDTISEWWFKWYMKAGHKRLGRILVRKIKDKEKTEKMEL